MGISGFSWGAQNAYHKSEGSFTGENSLSLFKEMGADFALLGHSERRYVFGEDERDIEKKFHLMQEIGLVPVLCVGEDMNDRFKNKKKALSRQISFIKQQLKYEKLPWNKDLLKKEFQNLSFILAYEPVWAIGTGEVPSSEELGEVVDILKSELSSWNFKLFYGGSLNKDTVDDFLNLNLDGFLIGSASLDPDHLYEIFKKTRKSK